MKRVAVIDIVGLTRSLLPLAPKLSQWVTNRHVADIAPSFPAVTCTAQSNYLTGVYPESHGIVGNGWYFREDCEVHFWRQSNKLVQSEKVWETARRLDPGFTCANVCWWFNMYSSVDYAVTPRPMYPADGRKLPDVWTHPGNLRDELQAALGTFPLFEFWGPRTTIRSSRWIAQAARIIEDRFSPTLNLVYLPHLDYILQQEGPSGASIAKHVGQIDEVAVELITHLESRGVNVVVLSEYGISDVRQPVHLNRELRKHGLIYVREELGLEVLDPGASAAFAVADHQVAHVYINDPVKAAQVRSIIENTPGVAQVLDATGKTQHHINHARAGDLIAIAKPDAWFTYYYWLDDTKAPDYARTVDIHRKPGYDPVELFIDPAIKLPVLKVASIVARKKAGFRTLMDVIPLDATLVKGSHGIAGPAAERPMMLAAKSLAGAGTIASVNVRDLILRAIFD